MSTGLRRAFATVLAATLPLAAMAIVKVPEEKIPPLRPPKAELPPGFWELNGYWVFAGVMVLMTLAVAVAYAWVRFGPQAVPQPARTVRAELDHERGLPEDGPLLVRVSQSVKHYFQAAFELPREELTTQEFCRVVAGREQIGSDLAGAVSEFLRRCDEKKFSPAGPAAPPVGAVQKALELVGAAESRLEESRLADEKVQPR